MEEREIRPVPDQGFAGKRIVICLDGTWNKVADPKKVTNVVKLAQSVMPRANGVRQVVYYNSGVGTGGPIDRLLGGAFGFGIRSNVQRAYTFLALNYEPGDEIYIAGFSRGAYTARALAAVIGAVGVLRRAHLKFFAEAWEYYRVSPKKRRAARGEATSDAPSASEKKAVRLIDDRRDKWFERDVAVKALAVWDTVGSYGVPSGFVLSGLGTSFAARTLGFHDRQLGPHVENAFHAVAIDEARGAFEPTFWVAPKGDNRKGCEQVWFAGVHSDIGGGYDVTGLSDLALVWMMDRLAGVGLQLDPDFAQAEFCPCPTCELHRSDNLFWRTVSPYRRPLFTNRPSIVENGVEQEVINEALHWSVARRTGSQMFEGKNVDAYAPSNLPETPELLPVTKLGRWERELFAGERPHPEHGKTPLHTACWSKAIPPDLLGRAASG